MITKIFLRQKRERRILKGVFSILSFTEKAKNSLISKLNVAKTKLKDHKLNKNVLSTITCVVVAFTMATMSVFDVFATYNSDSSKVVTTAKIVTKKDIVMSLTQRYSTQQSQSPISEGLDEITEGFTVFSNSEPVGVVSARGKERINEAFEEILSEFDDENAEIYQTISFEIGVFNTNDFSSSSTVISKINPKVVVTKTKEKVEEIPFETVYEDTNSLAKGETSVKTEGKNGSVKTVEEVKFIDGEEISREVVETVTTDATNEVILQGTKSVISLSKKQIEAKDGICFPLGSASCYVSSDFGYRSFDGSFHDGIDYAANAGTPVYSAWDGVVVFAGWDSTGYGNYVVVEHSDGYRTGYAHLNEIGVSVGDSVNAGQLVGTVGSTGYSTGNHLHFNIRINGEYTSPAQFF